MITSQKIHKLPFKIQINIFILPHKSTYRKGVMGINFQPEIVNNGLITPTTSIGSSFPPTPKATLQQPFMHET